MVVVDGPMALATLAMCIAFVFVFIAGLRLQRLWTATRPLVIWIGIIAVAQIGIADAQTAANVILRLLALVWTASIVTYTTRLTDMTAVIARLCEPLRPLGVSPDRVAFLIARTIRLIPAVFDTVRGVREAQRGTRSGTRLPGWLYSSIDASFTSVGRFVGCACRPRF